MNRPTYRTHLLCLIMPDNTFIFQRFISCVIIVFFGPFVCVECVIVCLAQGVKGEGEKSGNGLPGDHFLETVQEADGRAG